MHCPLADGKPEKKYLRIFSARTNLQCNLAHALGAFITYYYLFIALFSYNFFGLIYLNKPTGDLNSLSDPGQ